MGAARRGRPPTGEPRMQSRVQPPGSEGTRTSAEDSPPRAFVATSSTVGAFFATERYFLEQRRIPRNHARARKNIARSRPLIPLCLRLMKFLKLSLRRA